MDFSKRPLFADVWEKDVWEFQAKSGSSGSCRLFLHFLGKIAVQEMSGKTPGSPRHPSSRHPRPSDGPFPNPRVRLNRGVSKPRCFPLFSGKVQIVSRTFSGLFLVGALNRPRKRKRTNRENPRKNPRANRENPRKAGKGQRRTKKEGQVQIGKPPRLKHPRLAALENPRVRIRLRIRNRIAATTVHSGAFFSGPNPQNLWKEEDQTPLRNSKEHHARKKTRKSDMKKKGGDKSKALPTHSLPC